MKRMMFAILALPFFMTVAGVAGDTVAVETKKGPGVLTGQLQVSKDAKTGVLNARIVTQFGDAYEIRLQGITQDLSVLKDQYVTVSGVLDVAAGKPIVVVKEEIKLETATKTETKSVPANVQ